MIGIVVPTRGMLFTEAIQSIERERIGTDTAIWFTHNKKIPDCLNDIVEKALSDKRISAIWFVEEDVVVPENALQRLIDAQRDIAFIDYGVNGWSCSARNPKGKILWFGFGCTLVHRRVFENMDKPWFRTDKTLRLNDWRWLNQRAKYGGHDIWFFYNAIQNGHKVKQIEGECEHLRLELFGTPESNDGLHTIKRKDPINKLQIIKKYGKPGGN